MVALTADEGMVALLRQATEVVEIRDLRGSVVGFFAPATLKDADEAVKVAALFDWDEIERRKASKEKGYTTREVFEHLLSLATDPAERAQLQELIDERRREEQGCARP